MNWKTFIALLFILGIFSCMRDSRNFSETNSENDSLDYFFKQANIDTMPYTKRLLFTEKALAIVEKQPNDSMNRVNYFRVANRYFNLREYENYHKITLRILKKALEVNDKFSSAKSYSYLGDYAFEEYEIDSAYYYYYKAEKAFNSIELIAYKVKNLIKKSSLLLSQKDITGSEKIAIAALRILEKLNDKDDESEVLRCDLYSLLANIYFALDDNKSALKYNFKALYFFNKNKIPTFYESKSLLYNNIGDIYREKKDYDSAFYYYNLGLQDKNLINDKPSIYSSLLNNYSYIKFNKKELTQFPKILFDALRISNKSEDFFSIIQSQLNLSRYFLYKKNVIKSQEYLILGYRNSKKSKLKFYNYQF